MRSLFLLCALILMSLASPAVAQAPSGYAEIYDAPTKVNLGGRPVVADIEFHEKTAGGETRLALVTDVTKFVVETQTDLKNWIANRRSDCGERWASGEPRIRFPEGAIRFSIYLEIEYWSCGWNGQGDPTRLAQETGNVDVTLIPYVENGKLQARLGAFTLSEQTGLSKYLPLEFVVRRALEQELAKLNENPKFYRAPQPLFDENFVYESISAAETKDDRIVITALYKGPASNPARERILRKLRDDGITQ
ncbi:hypothetical protein [Hyphococcus sp.]|uniref:hypothetical protein n=1 Tax=Hyphococcus sp. TaxID=2038636 RepID=UPI003D0BA134